MTLRRGAGAHLLLGRGGHRRGTRARPSALTEEHTTLGLSAFFCMRFGKVVLLWPDTKEPVWLHNSPRTLTTTMAELDDDLEEISLPDVEGIPSVEAPIAGPRPSSHSSADEADDLEVLPATSLEKAPTQDNMGPDPALQTLTDDSDEEDGAETKYGERLSRARFANDLWRVSSAAHGVAISAAPAAAQCTIPAEDALHQPSRVDLG